MKELTSRKDIRLKEYDYSQEGYYFITICTKNRECILSKITCKNNCRGVHCTSVLTLEGYIVDKYINSMKNIYSNVLIDEYVVMPNHVHLILIIDKKIDNTISKIIQQFKGIVTKELKKSIWQKSFYEHIIRNEKEYLKIKEYIINNIANWDKDRYY
ncbi:MAG: transposase [Clostridia bacterium]|nr:transposase [Clostridia bacterium]